MLDVLIVNYNNANQVIDYVNRIRGFNIIDRILILDNESTDDSFEVLKVLKHPKVIIKSSGRNGGYGFGNNFGIEYLKEHYDTKYILISNSDVYYEEEFLERIFESIIQTNAAVSTGLMFSPNGTVTYPWKIPSGWQYVFRSCFAVNRFISSSSYGEEYFKDERPYYYVDCVPGSLLLVSVDAFLNSGGYDEDIFLYCEETVLGIRFKNHGQRTILVKNESFIHDHPRSYIDAAKQQRLMWNSRITVLEKYYYFNRIQILVVRIISNISNALYNLRAKIALRQ